MEYPFDPTTYVLLDALEYGGQVYALAADRLEELRAAESWTWQNGRLLRLTELGYEAGDKLRDLQTYRVTQATVEDVTPGDCDEVWCIEATDALLYILGQSGDDAAVWRYDGNTASRVATWAGDPDAWPPGRYTARLLADGERLLIWGTIGAGLWTLRGGVVARIAMGTILNVCPCWGGLAVRRLASGAAPGWALLDAEVGADAYAIPLSDGSMNPGGTLQFLVSYRGGLWTWSGDGYPQGTLWRTMPGQARRAARWEVVSAQLESGDWARCATIVGDVLIIAGAYYRPHNTETWGDFYGVWSALDAGVAYPVERSSVTMRTMRGGRRLIGTGYLRAGAGASINESWSVAEQWVVVSHQETRVFGIRVETGRIVRHGAGVRAVRIETATSDGSGGRARVHALRIATATIGAGAGAARVASVSIVTTGTAGGRPTTRVRAIRVETAAADGSGGKARVRSLQMLTAAIAGTRRAVVSGIWIETPARVATIARVGRVAIETATDTGAIAAVSTLRIETTVGAGGREPGAGEAVLRLTRDWERTVEQLRVFIARAEAPQAERTDCRAYVRFDSTDAIDAWGTYQPVALSRNVVVEQPGQVMQLAIVYQTAQGEPQVICEIGD